MFNINNKNDLIFSIIIPLYNKEKYIKKSLISALNQKSNLEIIIINDKSNDKSLLISKKIQKKNNKIIIINSKKKLYVSEARNIGIKKAKGKYLVFLDADDSLEKNFLSNINKLIKNKNFDLIISDLGDINKKKILKKKNFIKKINLNKFVGYCWRNIYRKDFLDQNKIRFDKKILVCEDEEFVSKCILNTKNIHFLNKNYYNKNNETISLSTVNLGQNIYGLPIEKFLRSYLWVLISLSKSLHKSKNNLLLKKYFNNRIKLMLNKIYPLIIMANDHLLKKTTKKFLIFSRFLKKILYVSKNNFIKNNTSIDLNKTKEELILKFNYIVNYSKNSKIYFFCCDHPTFSLIKVMKKNSIQILGILDNNFKNFNKNLKILGTPLKNLNKEKDRIKKNKNIIIIVANQKKINISSINKQLRQIGIQKSKIKNVCFNF